MSNELHSALHDFASKVNGHPRMRSLLKGWQRVAGVTATDTGSCFTMTFANSELTEVRAGQPEGEPEILMRASEAVLRSVFIGEANPASLFLKGTLQVFASDRDQIKLDAIALVLWD